MKTPNQRCLLASSDCVVFDSLFLLKFLYLFICLDDNYNYKQDEYWRNLTRRAMKKRERREREKALRLKDDAKKRQERAERRKKREELKKKKEQQQNLDIDTESETDSDEDEDLKRDDQSKADVPFYNLTQRFKDHVIIVTGGGRGIGQSCALRLAQEGGILYILDYKRWKETIDEITEAQKKLHNENYQKSLSKYHGDLAKQRKDKNKNKVRIKKPRKIRFKQRVFHKQCDVTDPKQVKETIDEIIKERGYVDVVLNCVNTTGRDYGETQSHDVKPDRFDRIMKLNLYSTVNVCQAVIPYMKKESYGRIVNLAAQDGKDGHPRCLAFAAAKAAVINVTKTLGQEYAGTGITVNCIAPQYDEYHVKKLEKQYADKASKVPMGRAIDMEELAGAVAFVACEENTYTTGFCYDLTGGTSTY